MQGPKFTIGLNETLLGIVAPFWFKVVINEWNVSPLKVSTTTGHDAERDRPEADRAGAAAGHALHSRPGAQHRPRGQGGGGQGRVPGGGSQDGDQHEMKYFLSEPEIFLGEQDDSDPCRG